MRFLPKGSKPKRVTIALLLLACVLCKLRKNIIHTLVTTSALTDTSCVTIVASCKLTSARLDAFTRALLSWTKVKGVKEIIVVDWDSNIPTLDTINSIAFPFDVRVKSVNVHGLGIVLWRIGAAFNLGLSHVQCETVLKLDCDTSLHEDFVRHNQIDSVRFRYGDYRNSAGDENSKHLNGVFFAWTSDLRAIHGFDERFGLYGWDDSDLYYRLEHFLLQRNFSTASADFKRNVSKVQLIQHLPHTRVHHALEAVSICFNEEASKMITSWKYSALNNSHTFTCHVTEQPNGIYVLDCLVQTVPPTVQQLLKPELCSATFNSCLHKYDDPFMADPCITFIAN